MFVIDTLQAENAAKLEEEKLQLVEGVENHIERLQAELKGRLAIANTANNPVGEDSDEDL
jgi:hypothetical protein